MKKECGVILSGLCVFGELCQVCGGKEDGNRARVTGESVAVET